MNKKQFSAVLILLSFVAISCQFAEQIIDPVKKERKEITTKEYSKDGVKFTYPDNWKITEDNIIEGKSRFINLEDADNSIMAITLPEAGYTFELKEYSDNYVESMKTEIPIGTLTDSSTEDTQRKINGQQNQGIRKKFSITLLGEKVPHIVDFFSVPSREGDAIVLIQVPEEDWKAADKEFQIIFDSLKLP